MIIDADLHHIIRCPDTGARLYLVADRQELWSRATGKAFAIISGIPILISSEARVLSSQELDWLDKQIKHGGTT